MKYLFTVYELYSGKELTSFEKEFNNLEDAEVWNSEIYNIDTYCSVEQPQS